MTTDKIKMSPLPKTGYYELTRDLENPRPDRRSKSWHLKETLEARRVYVQVRPDLLRADVLAEVGKTGPARFGIELGVGYDRVCWYIEEDGTVVTNLEDRETTAQVVEAWNAGYFVFDDSITAYCDVVEKERHVSMSDVIDELVTRGYFAKRDLDVVIDLVRARAEASWAEEEEADAKKREEQIREKLNAANATH
jgi:predicted CopG family antitoxin